MEFNYDIFRQYFLYFIIIYSKAKAKYFVYRCKRYILQFLIIKPSSTFILLVLEILHIESYKIVNFINERSNLNIY